MNYFPVTYILSIVLLGISVLGQSVTATLSKDQSLSDYEKWVAPYKERNAYPRGGEVQPKIVVSVVAEKISFGSVISIDGKVQSFSLSAISRQGGCCSQIENSELQRIDQLLAKLPSDDEVLPPIGRRLVIQIASGNKFDVQVYDLANVPDSVLELLRLTKTRVRSSVLWLEPETSWTAFTHYGITGFSVTSDGEQTISSGTSGPIKVWETEAQSLLKEVNLPQNVFIRALAISPDESTVVGTDGGTIVIYNRQTWQVRKLIQEPFVNNKTVGFGKPHFIKSGKYLLLETDPPGLRIYETKNWRMVPQLDEIPSGAVAYYPATTKSRAVCALQDGQIVLGDNQNGRNIAALDKSKLEYVAYSPDESRVAIVTSGMNHEGYIKIRIWDTDNGEFVKEVRPFEQDFCESVDGIGWSPGGRFLLAITKASPASNRSISVWDVESGRHRAELSGCVSNSSGPGFFLVKNKIIAGCADDNVIRVWDYAKVVDEITKFEEQIVVH